MKKLSVTAVGALAGLSLASSVAFAADNNCGKVSVGKMNWGSAAVITEITNFLMVKGYGCDVKMVPTATVTAITSLAENSEPDVVPELWPNSAPAYEKLAAEGKVIKAADVISDGGNENWWIPDYLAEKHPELTKLEGILKNPKLVGGKFHNCPEGWGCRKVNDSLIQAFGLKEAGVEIFNHGSGETLAAAMASAYENKEPYFGYYWGPTAPLGKYNMVPVDLGPYNAEVHTCNGRGPDECPSVGKSSFPAAPVLTVVTKAFKEKNPEVFELVSNISFTNKELSEILAWKDAKKASAADTAAYWLTNNKDTWIEWVNDDAAEKLNKLIK
ncbi:MAG: ABC transporter substrate-binding protein [Alphaproteobacteria bacterium]|nr:ABC transporter substrate-binding protein [Alphaproteobacteria bacterium]